MAETLVLGIDQGGSGTRAVLLDRAGTVHIVVDKFPTGIIYEKQRGTIDSV